MYVGEGPIKAPASGAQTPLTVRAADIQPLLALAKQAGLSDADLLGKEGLSKLPAGAPVALTDYFRLLERLSDATGDETFRLSSRPLMAGSTQFIWSNLAGVGDLAEAMRKVAKSYNLLHGGHYNRVERRSDALVYVIDDSGFPYTATAAEESQKHFTVECILIFLHAMLSKLVAENLEPRLRKVYSRRQESPRGSGHMGFFGAPVRWRAPVYALAYDRAAASFAICGAESRAAPDSAYAVAIEAIERRERGRDVRTVTGAVCALLDKVALNQEEVARALGMSVATLRRRLTLEGAGFRTLRRESLNKLAKDSLRHGIHPDDVAEQLRFSDLRSFSRAFKAWNGMTPKSFIGDTDR